MDMSLEKGKEIYKKCLKKPYDLILNSHKRFIWKLYPAPVIKHMKKRGQRIKKYSISFPF